MAEESYLLWVSEDNTVMVRWWLLPGQDDLEVCVRPTPGHTWGPPVKVRPRP